MDSHKHSAQIERLEVVETGRRRRWSDDEKLRIVMESLQTPRAISSTARRHGISRSLLVTWRRSFRPEPIGPEAQQGGFVPAMVVAADTAPTMDAAPVSGRMVIVVGKIVLSSLTPASMRPRWRGCCRFWSADDPDSIGQSSLDRDRPHGHETRHAGAGLAGSGGLKREPHGGDLFIFRGRRGDLAKILWHDGIGLSLYAKRLDRGRFIWPSASDGAVSISAAQMAYMLEGIDWRNPQLTWRPKSAG